MKKLIKAIIKIDLNTIDLANAISDIIIEYYGEHNYEDFKKVINKRLK